MGSYALAASSPTKSSVREATPQEAAQFIKSTPSAIVIDVRTPQEFAEGHIAGATSINVLADDFDKKIAALDRKTPLLIHCRSGGRSRRALAAMEKLHFEQVVHLTDGLNGWKAAGLPIVKSLPNKESLHD